MTLPATYRTIGEANGGVSIWELLLAGAIGKQHTPAPIQEDLLHLAIWVVELLDTTLALSVCTVYVTAFSLCLVCVDWQQPNRNLLDGFLVVANSPHPITRTPEHAQSSCHG